MKGKAFIASILSVWTNLSSLVIFFLPHFPFHQNHKYFFSFFSVSVVVVVAIAIVLVVILPYKTYLYRNIFEANIESVTLKKNTGIFQNKPVSKFINTHCLPDDIGYNHISPPWNKRNISAINTQHSGSGILSHLLLLDQSDGYFTRAISHNQSII